ncbi:MULTISPECIES: DUF262 domain-containing protein [Flavobacterium]|nr:MULTISPECIES: DUF262 domain-containing protein [Flavobacterium]MBZ4040948.1 DUF262 domain-containing protein [Flavobacterium hibisci]
MKVKLTTWKISTLFKLKDKINPQPPYQRGEVWKYRKNALLIDSILRGIDIPKIYLRKLENAAHDYEIADGQQRLNAIFTFLENDYSLLEDEEKGLNLKTINQLIVGGKKFRSLDPELKDKLTDYEVSIAIIEEADNYEIRTLFGRLQEGEPLVPAEKRNAIISKAGTIIDNFVLNNKFFANSKIQPARYKRQDYLAHALALFFYKNTKPLKASLLLELYLDKKLDCSHANQKLISDILDAIYQLDQLSQTRVYKKFHFIDLFLFLMNNSEKIKTINYKNFAREYDSLEVKRLKIRDPKTLLSGKDESEENKILYDYYMAFKYAGAEPDSIEKRNVSFNLIFKNIFN